MIIYIVTNPRQSVSVIIIKADKIIVKEKARGTCRGELLGWQVRDDCTPETQLLQLLQSDRQTDGQTHKANPCESCRETLLNNTQQTTNSEAKKSTVRPPFPISLTSLLVLIN